MLTIDQCLGANRPLIYVVTESDMEVLQHLDRKYKDNKFFVYSTTLAKTVALSDLLKGHFNATNKQQRSQSTIEVLDSILIRDFNTTNNRFETYVFLDCEPYINDKQIVRKIKDILARYQLDETFTVNMIFMAQSVSVPINLERLTEVVFYDLPSGESLENLSNDLTKKLDLKGTNAPSVDVVNNLKGLTLFEVEQAYLQSYHINKGINLDFITEFKKAAIAKTDLLSLLESNVTFDDIGGLDTLKSWVRTCQGGWTVEGQKFGLPLLKGLLMVGLPGCGKSLISKAIGNEWKLPVIQFDPTRIFSSRVGDSEANMHRVLQIVENISPCVLFIDEIEKGFAGMQSSTFSDSGVTARVIGSFLIWLQECKKPVFTVATSNQIHYLPPELISRFDETFFVNMPQMGERKDIFRIHIDKLGRSSKKFDLDKLAEKSLDLSGREIEQTLKGAMYEAFHAKSELNTQIILEALSKKTSLLTTMAEQLNLLLKWVGWDDNKKDGVRARFASPVLEMDRKRIQDAIEQLISDTSKKPDDSSICPG